MGTIKALGQVKGWARRNVLCSVRESSERSENTVSGLFQHPARLGWFLKVKS